MIRNLLLAAVVATPVASPLPAVPVAGALVHAGAVYDAAARARLPHVSVKATDHDGSVATYDGVRLADVLHDSGAPIGAALRGAAIGLTRAGCAG